MTRRDDREYREYLREEQRSQRGCIAGRMQLEFHHGLLAHETGTYRNRPRSEVGVAAREATVEKVRSPIRETALREDAIFAGIQNLGLLAGNENFDIITVKMNLNHCVP